MSNKYLKIGLGLLVAGQLSGRRNPYLGYDATHICNIFGNQYNLVLWTKYMFQFYNQINTPLNI